MVVGYVETHGRKETEALLAGLEIIPRRQVEYRGTTLTEMDLDAVLARHPQLVLVDELAHTNAPGSRHPKRYQDVEEILAAGIDVYTTVNIQHLESLNDVVQQITGVTVRETVPDRLVDEADEIELVDLPTDELLQRLREGKVYVSDQAARALEKFFRKGNLTALRELSLRRAADRVDNQMLDYMQTKSIPGPLAGRGADPGVHQLAPDGRAPGAHRPPPGGRPERRMVRDVCGDARPPAHAAPRTALRIQRNLQLAEELGAKVISITGESVAGVGHRFCPRAQYHQDHRRQTAAPALVRAPPRLGDRPDHPQQRQDRRVRGQRGGGRSAASHCQRPGCRTAHWGAICSAWAWCVLVTLAGFPLHRFLDPTNLVMLYLVAVVICGRLSGAGAFDPGFHSSACWPSIFSLSIPASASRSTIPSTCSPSSGCWWWA